MRFPWAPLVRAVERSGEVVAKPFLADFITNTVGHNYPQDSQSRADDVFGKDSRCETDVIELARTR